MNLDELEPVEVEAVLPLLPSPLEADELNSRLRVNMDEGTTICDGRETKEKEWAKFWTGMAPIWRRVPCII